MVLTCTVYGQAEPQPGTATITVGREEAFYDGVTLTCDTTPALPNPRYSPLWSLP
jgi:hypothetical protein